MCDWDEEINVCLNKLEELYNFEVGSTKFSLLVSQIYIKFSRLSLNITLCRISLFWKYFPDSLSQKWYTWSRHIEQNSVPSSAVTKNSRVCSVVLHTSPSPTALKGANYSNQTYMGYCSYSSAPAPFILIAFSDDRLESSATENVGWLCICSVYRSSHRDIPRKILD